MCTVKHYVQGGVESVTAKTTQAHRSCVVLAASSLFLGKTHTLDNFENVFVLSLTVTTPVSVQKAASAVSVYLSY